MRDELERLLKEVQEIHVALREEIRGKWQRSLPFEEELFDRWERARSLGFGEGSSVYQQSYIYGDVKVGANTWIGPLTILDGTGGLTIGDNCSISAGVQIYTHDTVRWALSGGKAKYEYAPVRIESCCHIGAQAVIIKGVTIGDRSIIGALSFVNRNIPPCSVAVGIPARVIGKVEVSGEGNVRIVYLKEDSA